MRVPYWNDKGETESAVYSDCMEIKRLVADSFRLECSTWWYLRPGKPLWFTRALPVNPLRTLKTLGRDLFAQPSRVLFEHFFQMLGNL